MQTKLVRLLLLSIFIVILSVGALTAQAQVESEAQLWGAWEAQDTDFLTMDTSLYMIGFYPDGYAAISGHETYGMGSYRIEGNNLYLDLSVVMPGRDAYVDQSRSYQFTLSGSTLTIHTSTGDDVFLKTAQFTPDQVFGCPNGIPSRMITGFQGMTSLKSSPTNLRAEASTSSAILQELRPGSFVNVLGGPVCSENYTWWQVRPSGDSTVGWMAEGVPGEYFLEPFPYQFEEQTTESVENCPAMPSRMVLNQKGRVVPTEIDGSSFRDAPRSDNVLFRIYSDSIFTVIGGPLCLPSTSQYGYLQWWNIQLADGQIGWVSEGGAGEYWIEPFADSAPVVADGIVGKWEGTMETWEFFPDGTFVAYSLIDGSANPGTYSLQGNQLFITFNYGSTDTYTYEPGADQFNFYPNGPGVVHSYWRVDQNVQQVQVETIPVLTQEQAIVGFWHGAREDFEFYADTRVIVQNLEDLDYRAVGTYTIDGSTIQLFLNDGLGRWNEVHTFRVDGDTLFFDEGNDRMYTRVGSLSAPQVQTTPDQSFKCGSSQTTNLFIGARAKVAFVTGSWSFQLYNEPHQAGGDAGSLIDGSRVNIVDGPVCADNAIWWKLDAFWDFKGGWAPEVTGSGRYLLRLTQDPADTTALFDPLWTNTAEYMVEAESLMKVYQDATPMSAVIGTIWPGTAHQIIGQSLGGMYQIPEGWICSNRGYLTNNGKPVGSRLMVSNNSASCTWEDLYIDPETTFVAAGATVYQPGQYPHQAELLQALGSAEAVEFAEKIGGLATFVTQVNPNGIDMICAEITAITLTGVATGNNVENPIIKAGDVTCMVFDWASKALKGKPLTGVPFLMAYIVANHEEYLDPYSDWANAQVDKLPLTSAFCNLFPNICVGGPGASN